MSSRLFPRLLATALLAASVATVHAAPTLLGDEISAELVIPNLSMNQTKTTTVTADATDAMSFLIINGTGIVIDPSATGFGIRNATAYGLVFVAGSYLLLSGLDFTEGGSLGGATLTSTAGWASSATMTFGADFVRLDFLTETVFGLGESAALALTARTGAVPEPSSLALVLGAGLALMRQRRRRAPAAN